jgi:hypothetical protein
MLETANPLSSVHPIADEISVAALLDRLGDHAGKALIFHCEDRDVRPGYHVTEVKSGAFEALDCGTNFETWRETFIQLWDLPAKDGQGSMPVAKFLAIVRKVGDRVRFDRHARLTFEVSDGVGAIGLYRASSVDVEAERVRVHLTRRPASCKPRDRWLEPDVVEQSRCRPAAGSRCCN